MKGRNIGIFAFGIILLVIGLMLSLYEQVETRPIEMLWGIVDYPVSHGYPYQFVGIPLAVAGVILTVAGVILAIYEISPKTMPVKE